MSAINPYQPPEHEYRPPDPAHCWELDGGSVLVRHQGALPAVDLETGAIDVAFTAVPRVIQKANFGLLILGIGIALFAFTSNAFDVSPLTAFICIFLVIFVAKISGRGGKQVLIWEQVESSKARVRKRRNRIQLCLIVLPALLLIALALTNALGVSGIGYALLATFVSSVIVITWSCLTRPKTRYAAGPEGWMRISGCHPLAISHLDELHEQRRYLTNQPDATRTSRVATAYLHRFPLKALLAECHRQPSARFWLTIMHVLRSKNLQIDIHPPSEAEEIDLPATRKILQDAVAAWHSEAPGWTLARVDRLTTPGRTGDNETAFLASPQLRVMMTIQSSQSINQSPDKPVRTLFISRNGQGLHLVTTNEPAIPIPNEGAKCQRAEGTPEEIHRQHLQFIAGEDLRTAADPAELVAWAMDARDQSFLALQKAGLCGPTREIHI